MSATATALLEREEELATIAQVLDAAAEGSGGLLTIEGEAGAGKTALLQAGGRLGTDREMLVQRARGGEYERDFPYGVVRQLFEPLLLDEARRAELLTGSAALAAPVFEPSTDPAEGGDPFAIQHGLYWLTADLAAAAPLLLLVDDAQWADLASLRALAYIGRRLDGLPAVLGLTVRTGEPDAPVDLLDELRREAGDPIEPPPLSVEAAARLVEEEVGGPPSERFAETCCKATAGNPFLLSELLRAIDSEGADPTDESAERLTQLAAAGVARSVLARLARLGEHSTEVARAVAVLEPNAETRLVADLAGLPPEAVAEVCERLVVSSLLSDSRPISFVHPLVREAVLADIPKPRRALMHAHAAHLLSERDADADSVAAHLLLAEAAGDDWVVAQLRSAATAALGRGAPDAAVRYLRRALREPPANEERLATSRELGVALLRANDPEGLEVLRTVRAAVDHPVQRAELAIELASSLGVRNDCQEAAALLEEGLAEIGDPDCELGLLLRGWLLLQVAWGLERLPEFALPNRSEEPGGETLGQRLVLGTVAFLHAAGIGSMERAASAAETVLANRDRFIEDSLAGLPPQGALVAMVAADRGDRVHDLYDLAIEASRRRGVGPGNSGGYGIRSFARLADGDLREAQADSEIALDLARPITFLPPFAIWTAVAIRIMLERGEVAAAEQLLVDLWDGRDRVPGSPGALLLCARGELRHATGRHAEARHDFLAAAERLRWLPLANPEFYSWRTGVASCEAALGNAGEARRLADEAVELARRAGGARGIGICLRVRGTVGEGQQAIEALREATRLLAGTRARLQHAHALVDLGAALRRTNRRKEAREPLREGLDLAHRCGATPLEERARTELAATGARPRKAVLTGVESLTPSELRVARMAAEGMTNREIAQSLTVTAKTVETHMRHVFQKLDVERRTELAAALAAG